MTMFLTSSMWTAIVLFIFIHKTGSLVLPCITPFHLGVVCTIMLTEEILNTNTNSLAIIGVVWYSVNIGDFI